MIYVDATNAFRTLLSVPTGIPRLERAIGKFFLSMPAKAQLIYFSSMQNDWIVLNQRQARSLSDLFSVKIGVVAEWRYSARLSFGLRAVLSTPRPQDYELHRAVARIIGGEKEKSLGAYEFHKSLVRSLGFATLAGKIITSESRQRLSHILKPGDQMLVSSVTLMRRPEQALREPYGYRASVLLHDTIPLDHPNFVTPTIASRFPNAFRAMMRHGRRMICVSHHTMERSLYWRAKMAVDKLPEHVVLRTSSPLIETIAGMKPVDRVKNRSFVLYCSTIEPRKNHLTLLSAWRGLIAKLGESAPLLVLCGRVGWKYASVLRFIEEHKELVDTVIFIHDIEDDSLAWLYQNARFTVFPSFDEGWGLAASESLDFGTPAIISTAPALVEATRGLMPAIDAHDERGWADAMVRLSEANLSLDELRQTIRREYRHTPLEDGLLDIQMTLQGVPNRPVS